MHAHELCVHDCGFNIYILQRSSRVLQAVQASSILTTGFGAKLAQFRSPLFFHEAGFVTVLHQICPFGFKLATPLMLEIIAYILAYSLTALMGRMSSLVYIITTVELANVGVS